MALSSHVSRAQHAPKILSPFNGFLMKYNTLDVITLCISLVARLLHNAVSLEPPPMALDHASENMCYVVCYAKYSMSILISCKSLRYRNDTAYLFRGQFSADIKIIYKWQPLPIRFYYRNYIIFWLRWCDFYRFEHQRWLLHKIHGQSRGIRIYYETNRSLVLEPNLYHLRWFIFHVLVGPNAHIHRLVSWNDRHISKTVENAMKIFDSVFKFGANV